MEGEETNKPQEPIFEETVNLEKLSKNQQKKMRRQMKWLETKQERRKASKEKKKQRLANKREKGEDVGPSRKNLKLNLMKNSSCKIKVALDLSLEEYMSDKDITSLTSQIQHSYSANRRAANPMQLYACGLGGRTLQRLNSIGDYKGWDVHFKKESYHELFSKESLVYLSSESPNILDSLSDDKVYVIGGLVDHNAHKGLCHRLAEEKGIAHAQLPISEYIHLKGRKVLAVNHVFSILLRFTETGNWKAAFMAELPSRKGFAPVFDENETKSPSNSENNKDASSVLVQETDLTEENLMLESKSGDKVNVDDKDNKSLCDDSSLDKVNKTAQVVGDCSKISASEEAVENS